MADNNCDTKFKGNREMAIDRWRVGDKNTRQQISKSNKAEGKIHRSNRQTMHIRIIRIVGLTNNRYNIVNRFGRCADTFGM